MAYDIRFKKRAIKYHEEGNSIRKTSATFGISTNTLNTWIQQYRKEGKFLRKQRVHRHKIEETDALTSLSEKPDSYQAEMAIKFGCSQSTVSRSLKRLGITRKKR